MVVRAGDRGAAVGGDGVCAVVRELGAPQSIWRMDSSGSWTQLASSGTLTVAGSDVWTLEAVGSTISGYQDGNLVVKATDSTYDSGSPGVWLYYAGNKIADWSGGDVGSGSFTVGARCRGCRDPWCCRIMAGMT